MFILRDIDSEFDYTTWNPVLRQEEATLLTGVESKEWVEEMLETVETIEWEFCMTAQAWSALQELMIDPDRFLQKWRTAL